jgi:hypothetical protein
MVKLLFAISTLVLGAQAAYAVEGSSGRGALGVVTGFALPSPGSQSFAIGFKGSYKFIPQLRTSLYYYTFGSGANTDVSTIPYVDANVRTSLIGGDATVRFFDGGMIGAIFGYAKSQTEVDARTATGTARFSDDGSGLYLGPTIQYDAPIGGAFTLGGELGYAFALSSSVPKTLLLLATAKFNF